VDDSSVAKETINDWDSNINVTQRMQLELRSLDMRYGNGFSKWWKEMTVSEKKKLLLHVTNSTIPLETPGADEIQERLTPGSDLFAISRALFEYNVETLTDKDCVLREIDDWVNSPQQKEDRNMHISRNMRKAGTFPDMFGGVVVYVVPEEGGVMRDIHMMADKAPAETIQKYKKIIEQGLLYDGSAAYYGISRKLYSLCLLIRLYDEYQVQMRRQNSLNPMERLMGCGKCKGSCEGAPSKRCLTCKVVWFCCDGCMVAANHKPCPHRKQMLSVCIFR
jgi:hypothetical protein